MGNSEKFHPKPGSKYFSEKQYIIHFWKVSQVIGKSPKKQKDGKGCFESAERRRFTKIFKTRKSSNQSIEKKFYKMHVNLWKVSNIKDGEVIKNEKHGKLGKICPFPLKLRQSARV